MKLLNTSVRYFLLAFVIILLINGTEIFAQQVPDKNKQNHLLAKALIITPDRYAILNINNLWSWQREDGLSNHSPESKDGAFFPRNISHVIYQDGIIWGSKVYVAAALSIPGPYWTKYSRWRRYIRVRFPCRLDYRIWGRRSCCGPGRSPCPDLSNPAGLAGTE